MPTSPDDQWEKVRRIAMRGYNDAIDTLACIEVLELGNAKSLVKRINEAGAKSACELIYKSVFQRIAMTTIRAYGPIRTGDFHLAVAFKLLEKPDVLALASHRGSLPHVKRAIELWQKASANERVQKLRHHRNKFTAHLSDPGTKIGLPLINELFAIARITSEIAENLSIGASTCTIELKHQIDVYRHSAERFWSVWDVP